MELVQMEASVCMEALGAMLAVLEDQNHLRAVLEEISLEDVLPMGVRVLLRMVVWNVL
jgi:hypothetical protein